MKPQTLVMKILFPEERSYKFHVGKKEYNLLFSPDLPKQSWNDFGRPLYCKRCHRKNFFEKCIILYNSDGSHVKRMWHFNCFTDVVGIRVEDD